MQEEKSRENSFHGDGFSEHQFPCPVSELLGWQLLAVDMEKQAIRCSFEAAENFKNPAGLIQGGILAAMLDETMGQMVIQTQGKTAFPQTLEMKVSFLAPATVGRIYGEACFIKRGTNILFIEGRLLSEDSEILAVASMTSKLTKFSERSPA